MKMPGHMETPTQGDLLRNEVAGQDVGETGRGTMVGPVMGGPPLTMPQGVPTVYGPATYPVHFRPHLKAGWNRVLLKWLPPCANQQLWKETLFGALKLEVFWVEPERVAETTIVCWILVKRRRKPNQNWYHAWGVEPNDDGFWWKGGDTLGWFRGQAQNGNPSSPEAEMDPMELFRIDFRIRCLREAEADSNLKNRMVVHGHSKLWKSSEGMTWETWEWNSIRV